MSTPIGYVPTAANERTSPMPTHKRETYFLITMSNGHTYRRKFHESEKAVYKSHEFIVYLLGSASYVVTERGVVLNPRHIASIAMDRTRTGAPE